MSKRWYVVHAYSGMEKSVGRAIRERVERSGMQDLFGQILVPTEEVVEMKNGQRTISERRFFPGYVLVEMEMNDDTGTSSRTPARSLVSWVAVATVLPPSRRPKSTRS